MSNNLATLIECLQTNKDKIRRSLGAQLGNLVDELKPIAENLRPDHPKAYNGLQRICYRYQSVRELVTQSGPARKPRGAGSGTQEGEFPDYIKLKNQLIAILEEWSHTDPQSVQREQQPDQKTQGSSAPETSQ